MRNDNDWKYYIEFLDDENKINNFFWWILYDSLYLLIEVNLTVFRFEDLRELQRLQEDILEKIYSDSGDSQDVLDEYKNQKAFNQLKDRLYTILTRLENPDIVSTTEESAASPIQKQENVGAVISAKRNCFSFFASPRECIVYTTMPVRQVKTIVLKALIYRFCETGARGKGLSLYNRSLSVKRAKLLGFIIHCIKQSRVSNLKKIRDQLQLLSRYNRSLTEEASSCSFFSFKPGARKLQALLDEGLNDDGDIDITVFSEAADRLVTNDLYSVFNDIYKVAQGSQKAWCSNCTDFFDNDKVRSETELNLFKGKYNNSSLLSVAQ